MTDTIVARVELHQHADGTRPNYEVLKANMATRQFFHQWREGSALLTLPTGEYVSTAPMSLNTALLLVMRAAQETGFESCGTVRSSAGFRHFGLKEEAVSRFIAPPLAPSHLPALAPAKSPVPVPTIGALLADAMKRAKP
jgi:hypothetical protein